MSSLFPARLIGREDSPATEWNSMSESSRWMGKPWRRIELVTRKHHWKGEVVEVERDLTTHLGSRRFGFGITLILTRGVHDYADEPNV